MKRILVYALMALLGFTACDASNNDGPSPSLNTSFKFTHNWDDEDVSNVDFNTFQFTNENGDVLSIERLRYVISDIVFTGTSGEQLRFNIYNLIDVTNSEGLVYDLPFFIPPGNYANMAFTFGFDNEDNAQNYLDLNAASFNVPESLGGGYHYMQFDGKYLDVNDEAKPFNYHAIRAVDNTGTDLVFPQDTFFTVNLGPISISADAVIEVKANLAEWFRNPNTWNLNELNTVLMPNPEAQIKMYENGQTVFSLGQIVQ
ncbi:MbnP family protein [Winogradskyella aurantia]|uniref:Copper-binding protein MbnP-like domain-containing protein n=1 Tax=Winogradskyella aurantia TaxID=1915063 RepID=A0A265V083_9FLAO|nr:MbnP family protein [Winogradskyella aurantia]OZV70956.1 hypothetical protein CA834_02245 [Winogradskyella aurantia]